MFRIDTRQCFSSLSFSTCCRVNASLGVMMKMRSHGLTESSVSRARQAWRTWVLPEAVAIQKAANCKSLSVKAVIHFHAIRFCGIPGGQPLFSGTVFVNHSFGRRDFLKFRQLRFYGIGRDAHGKLQLLFKIPQPEFVFGGLLIIGTAESVVYNSRQFSTSEQSLSSIENMGKQLPQLHMKVIKSIVSFCTSTFQNRP